MAILKNNTMDMPTPHQDFWSQVLSFIKDNAVVGGLFALLWKAIDKIAGYYSERRREELKELIKEQMTPQIDKLSHSIDRLSDRIDNMK